MSKVAVVYWSSTGNTEAMAKLVAEGAKEKHAEVDVFVASDFSKEKAAEYNGIAFGCPAMGSEVLEECEFQPMFDDVSSALGGKKIALFGSYGWGDGEWMRNWEKDCDEKGISLVTESVICNEAPNDDASINCKALGNAIA